MTSVVDRLTSAFGSVFGGWESTVRATQRTLAGQAGTAVDPRERYAVLRWYYRNNGLYRELRQALYEAGIWNPALHGLRNPAYRIVESYPPHLWPGDLPGALPIQAANDRILVPIHRLWQWSNWASEKQVMARWLPMLGDVFVKVVRPATAAGEAGPRVHFQLIDPAHVTDFDSDPRANLTYCRMEVPQQRREGDKLVSYTHVEIWSKAEQSYRRWEIRTDRGRNASEPADRLGPPTDEVSFAQMGIDFVPLVHCMFLNVGEARGVNAYLLQLDKIDAVNQDATRLAQLLFRHGKATTVVHGMGNDPSGRPLAPPQIQGRTNGSSGEPGRATLTDDEIWYVPGQGQVSSLIHNLPYEAHRLHVLDGLDDLQRDCPEMAWARIMEMGPGEISGRALRFQLAPFVSRVLEVRGNAEDALARLDAMALTLGRASPPLFPDIGRFDQGDFEHTFAPREVIPISDYEAAQAEQLRATAAKAKVDAGAWSTAAVLRDWGYAPDEIETIARERAEVDVIPVEAQ